MRGKAIFLTVACMLWSMPVVAADTCDIAKDVAEKGYQEFKKDKVKGIKLFTKALQLCDTNPSLNYNLGLAYLYYGNPNEAVTYLERAVKKNEDVVWVNNLAEAYLQSGQNAKAQVIAEKNYKSRNSAHAADLYLRSLVKLGNLDEALINGKNIVPRYPKNKELIKTYEQVKEKYLAHYLMLVSKKQQREGVAGLQRASFFPEGARAYCLALAQGGDMDRALKEADRLLKVFPGDKSLSETREMIFDNQIHVLYVEYKGGSRKSALARAKEFTEAKYPGNAKAKKAYDDLFNAFIGDDELADIPAPVAVASITNETKGNSVNSIITIMEGSIASGSQPVNLTIDVDVKIPSAAEKNKYAVAVVIGNQRYKRAGKGIADVTYAQRDAEVMVKYLVKTMGYSRKNIIFKNDAGVTDFIEIFGDSSKKKRGKLHNFIRKNKSDVFIYYVGHGAPGPDGVKSYLVPVDASANHITALGFGVDELYQIAENLPAKSVTVVMDACFSGDSQAGALFKDISPAMLKSSLPVRDVKNGVLFASAGEGQVATWYKEMNHSTFTYFFLKGLGGEADLNRNREITVAEMEAYLIEEVPYIAQRVANRDQHPVVKGDSSFVLATLAK